MARDRGDVETHAVILRHHASPLMNSTPRIAYFSMKVALRPEVGLVCLEDYDMALGCLLTSGRRCLAQHACAAPEGVQHQRHEGCAQRHVEPQRARSHRMNSRVYAQESRSLPQEVREGRQGLAAYKHAQSTKSRSLTAKQTIP